MPQDFSNQNCRGKSFKRQNLTGANFSGADIRGVNFEGAKLIKANFSKARTGQTHSMAIIRGIVLFLTSGFLSITAFAFEVTIVGYFATEFPIKELKLNPSIIQQIGITTVVVVILFTINYLILIRGILAGLLIMAVAVALIMTEIGGGTGAVTAAGIGAVTAAAAVVVAAVAGTVVTVGTVVAVAVFLGKGGTNFTMMIVLFEVTISYLLVLGYFLWRIHREDERFAGLRQFGIALRAYGSTNFHHADLTEAHFNEATLKSARFLEAVTLRTHWQHAKKLETANLKGTMLANRRIRQLLVTANGKDQSFAGLNLKGAYLVNADLQNVDFTETDLVGADLRGANLTGACLENWLIDSTTLLEGAHADYVYLLPKQQERRPASGIFEQGEFAKLFQEIIDDVAFTFNNGIDWKAFLVSLEKLRVHYGETEVSVRSIEDKGDGVFVIKVNVPPEIDKAEFHQTGVQEYQNQIKLLEAKHQAQLLGKEEVITVYRQQNTDLMQIIQQQAKKPIEIHNIAKAESTMSDAGNKTITLGNIDNRGGVFNLAEFMKDVNNTINQLPETTDAEQPGLKEILIQFQTLILQANETELPEDVKKLALEQLRMLAQIGQNPNANKTTIQTLLNSLKGFIAHLPGPVAAHLLVVSAAHLFS